MAKGEAEAAKAETEAAKAEAEAAKAEAEVAKGEAEAAKAAGKTAGPTPLGSAVLQLASPGRLRHASVESAGWLSVARGARQRAEEALRSTMAVLSTPGSALMAHETPAGASPARPLRLSLGRSGAGGSTGLRTAGSGEWWENFGRSYDRSRPTPSPSSAAADDKENGANNLQANHDSSVGQQPKVRRSLSSKTSGGEAEEGNGGIFDGMSDSEEEHANGSRKQDTPEAGECAAEVGLPTEVLRALLTELVEIRHEAQRLAESAEAEAEARTPPMAQKDSHGGAGDGEGFAAHSPESGGDGEPAWLRQAAKVARTPLSAPYMAPDKEEQTEAGAETDMDHGVAIFTEDVVLGTPTMIRFKPRQEQPAQDPVQASTADSQKPAAAPPMKRTGTLRCTEHGQCCECAASHGRRVEEARLCVALRERVEDALQGLLESLPLEKLLTQQQLLEAGFGGNAEGYAGGGTADDEDDEQNARSPYDEFSVPASPAPAPAAESEDSNTQIHTAEPHTPMYRPFAMT